MGTDWVMALPLKVYTDVKTNFSQKIKDTYEITDKNFSAVGSSDTPAVFPFVYIQTLEPTEMGEDFESTSINGATFTFQVDVLDNESQTNARRVMTEIVRIMKEMGFVCRPIPSFNNSTNDVHRMVGRFRKTFGDEQSF